MVAKSDDRRTTLLTEQVTRRIEELTSGRIRNLSVEEEQGQVVVRGRVTSHHLRQLALQGALDLLAGACCRPLITVEGKFESPA